MLVARLSIPCVPAPLAQAPLPGQVIVRGALQEPGRSSPYADPLAVQTRTIICGMKGVWSSTWICLLVLVAVR